MIPDPRGPHQRIRKQLVERFRDLPQIVSRNASAAVCHLRTRQLADGGSQLLQHAEVRADPGQRVVDVVGDASGYLAKRREFVGVVQPALQVAALLFDPQALRDVPSHDQHAHVHVGASNAHRAHIETDRRSRGALQLQLASRRLADRSRELQCTQQCLSGTRIQHRGQRRFPQSPRSMADQDQLSGLVRIDDYVVAIDQNGEVRRRIEEESAFLQTDADVAEHMIPDQVQDGGALPCTEFMEGEAKAAVGGARPGSARSPPPHASPQRDTCLLHRRHDHLQLHVGTDRRHRCRLNE